MTQLRKSYGKAIGRSWQARSLVSVLLLALVLLPQICHAGSKRSARPASGTLNVWVPARIMGDVECWVYVDGKIVASTPPASEDERADAQPQERHPLLVPRGTDHSGWMIVDETGLILSMSHGRWNSRLLEAYINAPDPDVLHFFRSFVVPLSPGRHAFEVAYRTFNRGGVSASGGGFPFVITPKVEFTVKKSEAVKYYVPIPDQWQRPFSAAAAIRPADMGCEDGGNSTPDTERPQRWTESYLEDPIVKALHAAEVSVTGKSRDVVVLDLPQNLGGSREFDGRQIRILADVVSTAPDLPTREEIASCRSRYPQYSRSYAKYDRLLQGIEKDFESFYALARKLRGGADDRLR